MSVLSDFLLADLQPGHAHQFFYRAAWQSTPTQKQRDQLAQLLLARFATAPTHGTLVTSRLGLLSAWSAKAYGILQACGLDNVAHLERASFSSTTPPSCDPLLECSYTDAAIAQWIAGDNFNEYETQLAIAATELDTIALQHRTDCLADLGREPTAAELALVTEACSEHCRHITFNTPWSGVEEATPLLDSIRATHQACPQGTRSAFTDHAGVVEVATTDHLSVVKAETHNHPTGLAPWQGAATGVGGEIRDEAATGRGAASVAGCSGYMLADADLSLARAASSWPAQLATPGKVLLEAPLGAAAFANEFGRPTLTGFCRFHDATIATQRRGFLKPAMFVAGIGAIGDDAVTAQPLRAGDVLALLGGPGMLVGIAGGSSASSSDSNSAALSSVQRANPEMQRKAQEVINRCYQADSNPLRNVHDLGAGGLGVAVAELALPQGCRIALECVPTAQQGMSAAQILINEAQERFLLVVAPEHFVQLEEFCELEHCPLAQIGIITATGLLEATFNDEVCISLAPHQLFGPTQWPIREAVLPLALQPAITDPVGIDLAAATVAVLSHPNVADKSFLVTINDRSVGGLTARDQLVGPNQVAVADCAVTLLMSDSDCGRALACGERPALAALDPAAGARVAVAEALTNLASAVSTPLSQVKLALNWLGSNKDTDSCGELIAAVRGTCAPFLHKLGLAVVVGKDSLAMTASWKDASGSHQEVAAPTTCIATAFGTATAVAQVLTPELSGQKNTLIMRLSTAATQRLGASVLADCYDLPGTDGVDVEAQDLLAWWNAVAELHAAGLILAYHDISDGGMLATAAEMCFATNCGITLVLDSLCQPAMGLDADGYEQSADTTAPGGQARMATELFAEQPGALIEVTRDAAAQVLEIIARHNLPGGAQTVGWPTRRPRLQVIRNAQALVDYDIAKLRQHWSAFATQVRTQRDNPIAAQQEHDWDGTAALYATPHVPAVMIDGQRPLATVLRDQGSNGHIEMATALQAAGFRVRSLTVTELQQQPKQLDGALLALPGGFTHGDVLGAGAGTAATLLHSPQLRTALANFFTRDTLIIGVCNGAQILTRLGELLVEPCTLPQFGPNFSGRFECRLAQVEVLPCASPFLAPLAGVRLPVPVSCGEGLVTFPTKLEQPAAQPALRFCTSTGLAAATYPANVTGAPAGLCGFSTPNGQLTLLMPHPERATAAAQLSWCPPAWRGKPTPWHDSFVHACNHLR